MGQRPVLIINCKNYEEVSTMSALGRLLRAASAASARYDVQVAVAPPQHLLGGSARAAADITVGRGRVAVLAQHADCQNMGGTTGHVIPEMLKRAGVSGSIVNHSEHRVRQADAACTVKRLRDLGMISVLCVRSVGEAKRYASIGADYVAIEPPELIGSGRAVSTERPGLISGAARAVKGSGARLLCGAGIVSGADAARAAELGASGILVASGVIKNNTRWVSTVAGLARPLSHATAAGPQAESRGKSGQRKKD